jgi:predicted component of type VI protein secretion system
MLGVRKRRLFHETFIGCTEKVLFEHANGDGTWSGLTEHYVRVATESNVSIGNQILPVHITRADNEQCAGDLVMQEPEMGIPQFHTTLKTAEKV